MLVRDWVARDAGSVSLRSLIPAYSTPAYLKPASTFGSARASLAHHSISNTSLSLRVPTACQISRSMDSETVATEPSTLATLTSPT